MKEKVKGIVNKSQMYLRPIRVRSYSISFDRYEISAYEKEVVDIVDLSQEAGFSLYLVTTKITRHNGPGPNRPLTAICAVYGKSSDNLSLKMIYHSLNGPAIDDYPELEAVNPRYKKGCLSILVMPKRFHNEHYRDKHMAAASVELYY